MNIFHISYTSIKFTDCNNRFIEEYILLIRSLAFTAYSQCTALKMYISRGRKNKHVMPK